MLMVLLLLLGPHILVQEIKFRFQVEQVIREIVWEWSLSKKFIFSVKYLLVMESKS
jgi:hypothetical protein